MWNYPRPPRVEPVTKHIQVLFNGMVIADTHQARRVIETSGAPVYYVPSEDVARQFLHPSAHNTVCEWKGRAEHFAIQVGDRNATDVAWSYPEPAPGYEDIAGHFGFYPQMMDACLVDGETARPQPGDYYGGWITSGIVGPFKGAPGTEHW